MSKTIVITGASSGIGKTLAKHLASLDHHILAVARRKELLKKLQKSYPKNIEIVAADITKNEDQNKIKNLLPTNQRGIYLVHNAGIAKPRLIFDLSENEWDQHYSTNIKAPLFLTKLLLPHLINGGRVLQISTGLAHYALAGFSAYGTSKAAFYLLKEYFNSELKEQEVAFGSATPGIVDTPMQEGIRSCDRERFPNVGKFQNFFNQGELLTTETVAKFLSWLLLDVSNEKFIQGEWNIYDPSHHKYWAKPEEITSPK